VPVYANAAGCTDACRHCGREGCPPFGALFSLDELRELAAVWGPLIIDFEPTAHPDFPEVMDPAITPCEGVLATNGYGLARAAQPSPVFARLREFGYGAASLTLHGVGPEHDWFVGRRGAYDDILLASRLTREAGFGLHWNLFLNQRNLDHVPRLLELGQNTFGGTLSLEVPHHVPSRRLWRYERLRPSALALETRLPGLQELDPSSWPEPPARRTETAFADQWEGGAVAPALPWEPASWPPAEPLDQLVLLIARDRSVYLQACCAPPTRVGGLADGRDAIERRLRTLERPHADVSPQTARGLLTPANLVHPTAASVRYKAISARYYWGAGPTAPRGAA
jgi:hypothetical protein